MHKIYYTLSISNITCGSCVPRIEKCLLSLEFIKEVKINMFAKEVTI